MAWNRRAGRRGFPVWLLIASSFLLLAAAGCGDAADEKAAQDHGGGQPGQGRPGGQRPGQPAIPVAVTSAVNGSISSYYRATSTLEAEKEAQKGISLAVNYPDGYYILGMILAEKGDVGDQADHANQQIGGPTSRRAHDRGQTHHVEQPPRRYRRDPGHHQPIRT